LSIASTAMRVLAPRIAITGQSRSGRLCPLLSATEVAFMLRSDIRCRIAAD
jgi:hypothetical protein